MFDRTRNVVVMLLACRFCMPQRKLTSFLKAVNRAQSEQLLAFPGSRVHVAEVLPHN